MASFDPEKGSYQQDSPPIYPGAESIDSSVPAPPSYSQAIQDPTSPPPTYESLYGKVKAAKTESSGVADFMKKFVLLLAGTIGCTILIGVVMAIPIAMIVIGALHIHDCPAERYIPIYLVVAGSFWALMSLINLGRRCMNRGGGDGETNDDNKKKTNPIESIINTFLFAWFIAGNVWVYRTYGNYNPHDPTAHNYCDKTLFLFAFWIITAMYIMFGGLCCCLAVSGCLAVCFNASPT